MIVSYHNDIFILLLLMIFIISFLFTASGASFLWLKYPYFKFGHIYHLGSLQWEVHPPTKYSPTHSWPVQAEVSMALPWCCQTCFFVHCFYYRHKAKLWALVFCLGYNHESKKYGSKKGIWSLKEMLDIFNNIPIIFIEYTMLKTHTDQQGVITDIKFKIRYNKIKPLSTMKNNRLSWYLH